MKDALLAVSLLAGICCAGAAAAQPVPTKTITIYNNSNFQTIYPVIQAPIFKAPPNSPPVHDLWLQAQFDVPNTDTQIFNTTLLYRIYVNRTDGIAPHHSVTVTVPFFTQLLPANRGNLGTVDDQFIDWWNAMRVFLFDGTTAANAAYNYSVNRKGEVIPPIPVTPVSGAAVPTCTGDSVDCEPLVIKAYVNGFPTAVPAQLVEYTFAAAEGPPLAPVLTINRKTVNYNISGVDQIYLPAAIGASGNSTAKNTYLGSGEAIAPFRQGLKAFGEAGKSWPVYVPAYYAATAPTTPLPKPPAGESAYPQPQIPSTNVVYAESFRDPPPAPPVLSSSTPKGIGRLGTVGQGTLDLWRRCTMRAGGGTTCDQIRTVNKFFTNDFNACFPNRELPATEVFLRDVYGWVQFPGCSTPLSSAPGYEDTIKTYCDLQYNFFEGVPAAEIFNPYVKLVHETLASNAYAFSIDDAVSFKSLPGTGVIITVGGPHGLENETQTPLPTPTTYPTYCRPS